jgi:integrase
MKASQSNQKPKQKASWPPIVRVATPNGQETFKIAVMVSGQRIRETFKTRDAAELRAEQIRVEYRNEGASAFTLPAATRAEVGRCTEMLKPYNANLVDAVAFYVNHCLKFRNAPTINEIVELMVKDSTSAKRRARTIEDLHYRLKCFGRDFGARQLGSVTIEELKAWLDDSDLSPRTRINYATKISQLYNYAQRHEWVDGNLVDRIERPSTEDTEPHIFTVEQASALLEHAGDLLPYVALALFAGLRAAELRRLTWQSVKLSERCIIVGAEVAKKRSRRVVDINDTLAAWLAVCGGVRGPIAPQERQEQFHKRIRGIAEAAGMKEWTDNGLRHLFASYHLAQHGDAVRTAHQMGNSPDIVHRYYKGLVSNGDVERFWKLRPAKDAADKIVVMGAK